MTVMFGGSSLTRQDAPASGEGTLLNYWNMDAQDNQDPTLLHERLTRTMTASGFVDV